MSIYTCLYIHMLRKPAKGWAKFFHASEVRLGGLGGRCRVWHQNPSVRWGQGVFFFPFFRVMYHAANGWRWSIDSPLVRSVGVLGRGGCTVFYAGFGRGFGKNWHLEAGPSIRLQRQRIIWMVTGSCAGVLFFCVSPCVKNWHLSTWLSGEARKISTSSVFVHVDRLKKGVKIKQVTVTIPCVSPF